MFVVCCVLVDYIVVVDIVVDMIECGLYYLKKVDIKKLFVFLMKGGKGCVKLFVEVVYCFVSYEEGIDLVFIGIGS